MGKQSGANDVAVTVHGVDSPDQRNHGVSRGHIDRRGIVCVSGLEPLGRRRSKIAIRPRIAAIEYGAQMVLTHIVGRGGRDVGLDDLTDFFLQRHLR